MIYRLSEKPRTIDIKILVSVFFFSLGSYYFYKVGLYVFQMVGVLIAFSLFKNKFLKINNKSFFLLAVFFLYVFFQGSLVASIFGSDNFNITKLSLPLFVFSYLAFSAVVFSGRSAAFHRAFFIVILIHVFFFVFQFCLFYSTSNLIDFLKPFTGEEQRVLGGSYSVAYLPNFARVSGLFNEPGTYSTWMMLFLTLYRLNEKKLGLTSKGFLLEILVVGTVLLSFSSFGTIYSAIYLIGLTLEKKLSFKSVFFVSIMLILFAYFGHEYFYQRFSSGVSDSGLDFRFESIAIYLNKLSVENLIFGYGMFNDVFIKIDSDLVAQDVGLWFTVLSGCGIIGVFLLFLYFIQSVPKDFYAYILVILIMLSKFTLTNALVWVILFYFQFFKTVSKIKSDDIKSRFLLPNRILE